MGAIADNLIKIQQNIPDNVTLVAVSKTKPKEMIQECYDVGHRDFGENKVQDLVDKFESLPKDINWHFIGHLQTNKVKYIAPFIYLLHGVDSEKLLKQVNKEGEKNNRVINCLLQVRIAQEETKFGLLQDELHQLLDSKILASLPYVKVIGLMGMASFTEDESQVAREFGELKDYFNQIKSLYFKDIEDFKQLSMGMSGDYELAISNGSTMIRVGSSIFGERIYKK